MAAEQNQRSGKLAKLGAWLAVPRLFTLPSLFALGLGIAQLIWWQVDSVKFISWISGVTAPFCILCATAVWAMRDKANLAFLNDTLSAEEYRNASSLESELRGRSTALAARTCIAAFLASFPAVSNQLIGPIWHWMVLGGGCSAGYAIYAYLVAEHWDWQLRAHQSSVIYARKRFEEKEKLLEDIDRGSVGSVFGGNEKGWAEGEAELILEDNKPH